MLKCSVSVRLGFRVHSSRSAAALRRGIGVGASLLVRVVEMRRGLERAVSVGRVLRPTPILSHTIYGTDDSFTASDGWPEGSRNGAVSVVTVCVGESRARSK
jgi:hypothetical protein